MGIATDLLKAEHVGVRRLKENLSVYLKKRRSVVITEHGTPTSVIVPYSDIVELAEMVEELREPATVDAVRRGKQAVRRGTKGVPVSSLFKKIRAEGR